MNFRDKLNEQAEYVDTLLRSFLPAKEGFQSIVMDAMEYSVMAGGKRLRPILMKTCYDIFGGEREYINNFMAAMEMLHTYSLVHDDLPAMDNDEYRRGRKTTHIVYGEAMGILAGDALLNYAYETCVKAFSKAVDITDYQRISRAMEVFMTKSGIFGMIGGQVVDVISEGRNISDKELDFIFRLKTGALLEASMMIGAILAGADDSEIDVIEKIGGSIGMAFQIQDDILDLLGDEQLIGKPVLSDVRNEKTTYVKLYGLDKAKADVIKYSEEAKELLYTLNNENRNEGIEFAGELIELLVNRNK
jgi:geranylgeranyl diphosphate synthase type II